MLRETVIALRNYDWLIRNRGLEDVDLAFDSDTLVYGDGGADINTLCEEGFTPATGDGVSLSDMSYRPDWNH